MAKKKKRGAPTRYSKALVGQAKKLCAMGATDIQLADFFGVCEKTIYTWKIKHPEFLQALKESKDELDTKVERSLFDRAMGYSHPEDKILANPKDPNKPIVVETIKHYPPDSTSMIFWLKNRQPDKWRDRHELEISERPLVKRTVKRFDGQ